MFVLPVYNVANHSCMLELISFQISIDHGFSDCVCLCTTYRVFSLSASNGRYYVFYWLSLLVTRTLSVVSPHVNEYDVTL